MLWNGNGLACETGSEGSGVLKVGYLFSSLLTTKYLVLEGIFLGRTSLGRDVPHTRTLGEGVGE